MDIAPERQVKYVACKLKAGAGAWWIQSNQSRRREGKAPVKSWPKMKRILRSHFLPADYEQILYLQYQKCTQGNRSVSQYTEDFYRLNAWNNLSESTQQLIARYIGGLRENIQDKLELNSVWSLSQAVNFAYKAEIQLNQQPRFQYSRRTMPEKPDTGKTPISSPLQTTGSTQSVEEPSIKTRPPVKSNFQKENTYSRPGPSKCFRCFQPGHR